MTFLLFDEGPGVGLGHRRRMEVLARALHARGHACHLAPLDPSRRVAALDEIGRSDVVIVDSYRVRADQLALDAGTVAAVDDVDRDLAVDIVIDPSPGADESRHRRARRVLAGTGYALVAVPEPVGAVTPVTAPVTRILVTTGAADAAGTGARIASSVYAALADVDVRLVIGPWGAPEVPEGVTGVHAPASLADELASASVVVTAGGVSMLEACLLGRAVVAVIVAENQRVAVESLAAAGAVVAVEVDAVAAAVTALVSDPGRRAALAEAATRALDGHGAQRVAAVLGS